MQVRLIQITRVNDVCAGALLQDVWMPTSSEHLLQIHPFQKAHLTSVQPVSLDQRRQRHTFGVQLCSIPLRNLNCWPSLKHPSGTNSWPQMEVYFFHSSTYKYHLCRGIFEELFIGWTHSTRSSYDLSQCLLFIFTCITTSLSDLLYSDPFSSDVQAGAALHSVSHSSEHPPQIQPHQLFQPVPNTGPWTWLALTLISSC